MMTEYFTRNLRRLRQTAGLTQEQAAQKLGVSPQSVSRWECGSTLPDVMLLPELARIYGVSVDDFYREDCTAYPNYAQRLLAVYEASGRSEDFLAAEQEFTRLLTKEHTADDLRALGVLYHYMTRRSAKKAESWLLAAAEKAQHEDKVRRSAVQQYILLQCDLGKGKETAARYREELKKHPESFDALLLCIAAHAMAGEAEKALTFVKPALEKFPDSALLHVYAGDSCKALGQYPDAFAHWKKVGELDSAFLDGEYAMGFCHEELGQYADALAAWEVLQKKLLSRGLTQEAGAVAEHCALCRKMLQ